jgi:hypothetical protein
MMKATACRSSNSYRQVIDSATATATAIAAAAAGGQRTGDEVDLLQNLVDSYRHVIDCATGTAIAAAAAAAAAAVAAAVAAAGRWTDDEVDLLQNLVDSYRQAVALSAEGSGPRTLSNSLLPSENAEARPVACTVRHTT